MNAAIAAVVGYLFGSIPFGWLVAKAKGVDIFAAGSGNIGATNVGRVLGKPLGICVFLLDLTKGTTPTAAALWWSNGDETVGIAAGLFAVLGHMFSLFLRFRGGKGVATATGVMGVLFPLPTLLAVIAFVAVIISSQIMSLAAIAAALVFAGARLSLVTDLTNIGTLFALWPPCSSSGPIAAIWVGCAAARSASSPAWNGRAGWLPGYIAWPRACGAAQVGTLSIGVALPLFGIFKTVAANPPPWLNFGEAPEDLGSRLAGLAVGPLFPGYYAVQGVCGLLAAGVAVGWCFAAPGRLTRILLAYSVCWPSRW